MMTVQTNFRAQDMLGSTRDRPDSSKKASEPEKAAESDPNKVPEGTADEVLGWVGDDVSKARKALSAEKKDDSPRKTVVEPLEKMIEDDKQAKREASAAKKAAEKKSE
jgi:hypothetical protein